MPQEVRAAIAGTDASGAAALVVTYPPKPTHRKVWRITVTGPANTQCLVYLGQIAEPFIDGTNSGARDVAEYPNGMEWPAGERLYLVWNTAAGNAVARVTYE